MQVKRRQPGVNLTAGGPASPIPTRAGTGSHAEGGACGPMDVPFATDSGRLKQLIEGPGAARAPKLTADR